MSKDRILKLCAEAINAKALGTEYKDRLKEELKEVESQSEFDYFISLYDEKKKFPSNENNLLIPYLLGIVEDFDITKPPSYIYGEYPDIDIDYHPAIREYLKNEWAPKTFGMDKVCAIGSYNTFKLNSAIIDMARIHGYDRQEILNITTKLPQKDDDGKPLTWEKALELSKELAEYCKQHPEVADAAKRLINRYRSRGKHAGGLIISKIPIDTLVPLVTDEDGNPVSSWTEGLASQDLQPVGLIKFDLLVITNLIQIAKCCRLIQERYGLNSICALPGQANWSDESYLNDPKALAIAKQARLKGIFQFDGHGIQSLVKTGGVSCFEDLVAITAIFRPGPMGGGVDKVYFSRKKGLDKTKIHPLIKSILGKTYGVMIYQEDVMKILNQVGKIPLKDCYMVQKAISKKKVKTFSKYKDTFIENGKTTLNYTQEQMEELWGQIETFAGYGFNRSHSLAYTMISARLLWLKAHYPLEFYAAILSCEKDEDKIKDYKSDADSFGIKVNKVDLNKSKENFSICDDEIYMGFSNIKGIGEEVSKRIVENQPYTGFVDFLNRFGTNADVIKPLVALRLFGEDIGYLYEFYEHYKKKQKGVVDRRKRFDISQTKQLEELSKFTGEPVELIPDLLNQSELLGENFEAWYEGIGKENAKEVVKLIKKYNRSVDGFNKKESENQEITMEGFKPKGVLNDKLKEIVEAEPVEAEFLYYGFGWTHILEKSPDFDPERTFKIFEDDSTICTSICVQIVEKPKEKTSKSGSTYYQVKVEDANFKTETVIFWKEDYDRFKEELEQWYGKERSKLGNLLKMRIKKPDGNFNTYTFDSPPKRFRWKEVPQNKADDARILVMRRPEMISHKVALTPVEKKMIYEF